MRPIPLNRTLEEQERWAYAEGDTALAAVLARAADAEHDVDVVVPELEDKIEDLRRENALLQSNIDRALNALS